jgi:hypothetical protein
MRKRISASIAVLAIVAATAACIHKAGGSQVTPYEKAVTYSAMLAQANNSVAQGVIQLQQAGAIPVDQTDRILRFQYIVASDHEELSRLLADGPAVAKGRAQAIASLLTDIQTRSRILIEGGGLGVKNPQSKQTMEADVSLVVSTAQAIVTSLQMAGVLK